MENQFSRTQMLLGESGLKALASSRVAIFGVGGVGGYVAEALARSGVGALDLVDNDVVALSNLNRQILATHASLGLPKVDVAAARIKDINPNCKVLTHRLFFLPQTVQKFDFSQYDYIVDAIDTVTGKIALISAAKEAGVPVISSMGAGNKLDPTRFRVSDISKTHTDPLAKVIRVKLKQLGLRKVKVVWSDEPPIKPLEGSQTENSDKRVPGSVAFVPSVAGLIISSEVVKDLCIKNNFLGGKNT
ncbi:MAG: tRNA threonylcarbamoyladenosine dehydratase [Ruminococcaceae bacterium]|nr:tRNA threonylcarbamoyladenosine dehydratase [Oscillospiraceae bacterium]